jgi:hypothetical protein
MKEFDVIYLTQQRQELRKLLEQEKAKYMGSELDWRKERLEWESTCIDSINEMKNDIKELQAFNRNESPYSKNLSSEIKPHLSSMLDMQNDKVILFNQGSCS